MLAGNTPIHIKEEVEEYGESVLDRALHVAIAYSKRIGFWLEDHCRHCDGLLGQNTIIDALLTELSCFVGEF